MLRTLDSNKPLHTSGRCLYRSSASGRRKADRARRLGGELLERRDLLSLNLVQEHLSTGENTPLTITPSQLVAGDTDGNIALAPYFEGDLSLPGTQPANAKLVANANGTYTFTPNPGFTGTTSFQYLVKAAIPQSEIYASDGAANDGFGGNFGPQQVAISSDGNTAIVAATGINGNEQEHKAYIFTRSAVASGPVEGAGWTQQFEIDDPKNDPTDYRFGISVAIDGDTAVVGASTVINSNLPGNVYIYTRSGSTWSLEQTITSPTADNSGGGGNGFGQSVAISGNTVVVGSVFGTGEAGTTSAGDAWVYQRSGSGWGSPTKIYAPDGNAGDNFGTSLSIDGGTIAVGAPLHAFSDGAAYVFVQSGSGWQYQAELNGITGSGSFGDSVSVSGNNLAVGEPVSGGGNVSMYARSGSTWTLGTITTPVSFAFGDRFGASVSLSGTSLVVGVPDRTVNGLVQQGAAYAFTQGSDGSWIPNTLVGDSQLASEISANNGQHFDFFGTSVAASGDTFLIGVPGHTVDYSSQGAAYIQEVPWGVATAKVTVAAVPFNTTDAVYTIGSGTISVAGGNGLLNGDTAPTPLSVTAATVTGAQGGTFKINADGSFTYTPAANFPGYDSASFTVSDASGDSATHTMTVLSQHAAVVWKFYESVLNRTPEQSGLQYWTNYFNSGGNTGDMAYWFFESDELLNKVLGNYYQQYLQRPLDDSGLAYWKGVWHATGGPEQIKACFADSPEFYKSAGSSPDSWIDALYQRILSRTPDPAGKSFWLNYYQQQTAAGTDAGTVRYNIALGFFVSAEAFGNDVTGWFQEYLFRAPNSTEKAQYVSQMQGGASDRTIEQEITNLPEYASNPPTAPAGTATALGNYYQTTAQSQAAVAAKDALFASM